MKDWQRWAVALGLGAFGGLLDVATDTKFPGWWDLSRHMIFGLGPVVVALKMTLGLSK